MANESERNLWSRRANRARAFAVKIAQHNPVVAPFLECHYVEDPAKIPCPLDIEVALRELLRDETVRLELYFRACALAIDRAEKLKEADDAER